jgi:hypothetical protein
VKLKKILVPVLVVAGIAFAFWRSVHSARSEPYTLGAAAQRPWRLVVETPGDAHAPATPVLLLEPPVDLTRELFDQVFKRSMESMHAPGLGGIPLVFAGELERASGARPSVEELVAMARQVGLEAPLAPRCLAHRRLPEPRTRAQAYLAVFDSPAFATFRSGLAARLGAGFDPAAASPALFLGLVESELADWVPLASGVEKDCLAPINVAAGG